jgi:hypothetical protein
MLRVRRVLTETPLARQHERALITGGARKRPEIPWSSFVRSDYPDAALRLAFDHQQKLAVGEYGAVDLFARLASALSLHGAPIDIVAAAARTISDEIRHADYCLRMASLVSGTDAVIEVDPRGFGSVWKGPASLEELDIALLEISAIGETLAAALLMACKERATDKVAHAVFASITADEVHHARLGWYYFAWRAPQWSRAERQRAANAAGEMLMRVEPQFWHGRDAPPKSRKAAAALGVLDSVTQRSVVGRVMEDEIVPALDALGLGASHAWRARRRGRS